MPDVTPTTPPPERPSPDAPAPIAFARTAADAQPPLDYRPPVDTPTVTTGGALQGAAAICIAGFSVLMGAPGVAWLVSELPRRGLREPGRVAVACVIVLLGVGGLVAAIVTARDCLSRRNRRRKGDRNAASLRRIGRTFFP
jgi:hypothetical protein